MWDVYSDVYIPVLEGYLGNHRYKHWSSCFVGCAEFFAVVVRQAECCTNAPMALCFLCPFGVVCALCSVVLQAAGSFTVVGFY